MDIHVDSDSAISGNIPSKQSSSNSDQPHETGLEKADKINGIHIEPTDFRDPDQESCTKEGTITYGIEDIN